MFAKLEKLFKRFAYLNRKDYFCTRFICRGSVAQLDQSNSLLSCGSWVRIPTESLLRGKRILETKFSFLFIDCQPVGAYREVSLRVSMHDSKSKNVIFTLHTMYVARKNHAYEWLKRGEKRKENEKKDYPDQTQTFSNGQSCCYKHLAPYLLSIVLISYQEHMQDIENVIYNLIGL